MRSAFTLIELLVVITIIVVLLALLTPALDKAIYQAELVACGANQKVVSSSVVQYAMANRRRYPARPNMDGPPEVRAYLTPQNLYNYTASGSGTPFDFRPVLRDEVGLNITRNMQCALVEAMDLEDTLADEAVHAGQSIWFGWYYSNYGADDLPGMLRLGDRWGWGGRRYSILFSDFELNRFGQGAHSSHPDDRGVMFNYMAKRVGIFTDVTLLQTYSWWIVIRDGSWEPARGLIDMNFGYADGSVRRLNGVEVADDRMEGVPSTQSNDEGNRHQIPRE